MRRFIFILILMLITLPYADMWAQCPMCKMAVESNQANGGNAAQGLNNGILYLLMMPYILIGTLAFIWVRNKRKVSDE